MKVALCFSGQPRFVNECSDLIINNAIQNYDVDIFAHLWFDDDLKKKPYKHGGDGGWEKQRISVEKRARPPKSNSIKIKFFLKDRRAKS